MSDEFPVGPGDSVIEITEATYHAVSLVSEDGASNVLLLTFADSDGDKLSFVLEFELIRGLCMMILNDLNRYGLGVPELDCDPNLN
jgi:hypothetical protein